MKESSSSLQMKYRQRNSSYHTSQSAIYHKTYCKYSADQAFKVIVHVLDFVQAIIVFSVFVSFLLIVVTIKLEDFNAFIKTIKNLAFNNTTFDILIHIGMENCH